jgi:hypothetical protein
VRCCQHWEITSLLITSHVPYELGEFSKCPQQQKQELPNPYCLKVEQPQTVPAEVGVQRANQGILTRNGKRVGALLGDFIPFHFVATASQPTHFLEYITVEQDYRNKFY